MPCTIWRSCSSIKEGKGHIAESGSRVAEDSGGVEDRKVPQAAGGVAQFVKLVKLVSVSAEYCERLIREWINHYGR